MLFSSVFWYISPSFSRIDSCQKLQRFKCLQFLFVFVEKHQKHPKKKRKWQKDKITHQALKLF